jgi:hypothetical protein
MTIIISAGVLAIGGFICGCICAAIAVYNFFWGKK